MSRLRRLERLRAGNGAGNDRGQDFVLRDGVALEKLQDGLGRRAAGVSGRAHDAEVAEVGRELLGSVGGPRAVAALLGQALQDNLGDRLGSVPANVQSARE